MEIIVDGYNLIACDHGLRGDLERKRDWLVQQLSAFRALKGFGVTVVFDAWNSGSMDEVVGDRHGVHILYTRQGEKADDAIVRITRAKGSSCIVVTSDREVRRAVEKFGATAIYASEFSDILRCLGSRGEAEQADETEDKASKRGNPHRLSKTERKRREILRKLRP